MKYSNRFVDGGRDDAIIPFDPTKIVHFPHNQYLMLVTRPL